MRRCRSCARRRAGTTAKRARTSVLYSIRFFEVNIDANAQSDRIANGRRNFYAMRAPGGAGSASQSHSRPKQRIVSLSALTHVTTSRLQDSNRSLSPLTSVVTSMSRRAPSFSLHTLLKYDRIRFGVSCAARYRVSVSEVSNEEKGGQSDADRMGVRVG